VRRFSQLKDSGASIAIADGNIFVDNELIAHVKEARTGIFHGIVYPDYPKRSANSVGGIMRGST
jgi:3-hydroxyacyl-[acyl-carrier protein] dehydratase/trans-2-decenoyl-[acyl-carrier protein] isomerase